MFSYNYLVGGFKSQGVRLPLFTGLHADSRGTGESPASLFDFFTTVEFGCRLVSDDAGAYAPYPQAARQRYALSRGLLSSPLTRYAMPLGEFILPARFAPDRSYLVNLSRTLLHHPRSAPHIVPSC